MSECKACIKIDHFQEVQNALNNLSKMKNIKVCNSELYESRLLKCKDCSHKTVNDVCMMCGCYTQIRAFVLTNKCPVKNW